MSNESPVDFLRWLVSMDDPDNPAGLEERRTVTLTRIIDRARDVLAVVDAHRCEPPTVDPADRNGLRRWTCPDDGTEWAYTRRVIGRKMVGRWVAVPTHLRTSF